MAASTPRAEVSKSKQDRITIALVVLALLVITFCDNVILPGHNLTILYVVPVLVAALRASPGAVFGVAGGSLVLDAIESALHDDIYHSWPLRTAVLVVVYGFAVLIASQRQVLAERSRELEEANARTRSILDNAANAIFFVEAGIDRPVANWAAYRLFTGATTGEFSVVAAMHQFSHPDGSPLTASECPCRLALSGTTISNVELVVNRQNGERVPVLVSAAPAIGADGKIVGAVIVAQDIAVVKELERQREEWISIVAHDLRQPITTIAGYSQLLVRQAEQSAPQFRKPAEHILSSAGQLNRMIADLLDVSRIGASRLTLNKQSIDLNTFVTAVVERVGESTSDHPMCLEVGAPIPPIEVDPGRLEQILTNLLSNAAKYGYPNSEIRVTVGRRDDLVEVAVTNRGVGISAESLPHLFDRFYRTSDARRSNVAGLGLGLYITKGLVEAHGGQMRVTSAPGEETTFAFTLPIDWGVVSCAQVLPGTPAPFQSEPTCGQPSPAPTDDRRSESSFLIRRV